MNIFATRWGFADVPWDAFCQRIKTAGYDGLEAKLPDDEAGQREALAAFAAHGLTWVGHENTNHLPPDFAAYQPAYEQLLRETAALQPAFINVQTGKDYFRFEQNLALLDAAARIAAETGVPILHETHRGKWSYHPGLTRRYLDARPDLRLTLDASHWCCVTESMLDHHGDDLDAAIAQTAYVHTRVGFAEGPQVSDPRAPEWQNALNAHLGWWDRVVEIQGLTLLGMSPEFGAPPYLPVFPYTRQPLVSQWEVNEFMLGVLRERYGRGNGAA